MDDPRDVLPAGLWPALVTAHTEPPRRYHTLVHAIRVATVAGELGGSRACVLAAWLHDVVYDPGAEDNESASAAWAARVLAGDPAVEEVVRLIRLTATHDPAGGDRDGEVLCDADLSVLGGSAAEYEVYRSAVREEYAMVGEEAWRVGRAAVLERLLARPRLFRTEEGARRWEDRARTNAGAELARLRRG